MAVARAVGGDGRCNADQSRFGLATDGTEAIRLWGGRKILLAFIDNRGGRPTCGASLLLREHGSCGVVTRHAAAAARPVTDILEHSFTPGF